MSENDEEDVVVVFGSENGDIVGCIGECEFDNDIDNQNYESDGNNE